MVSVIRDYFAVFVLIVDCLGIQINGLLLLWRVSLTLLVVSCKCCRH